MATKKTWKTLQNNQKNTGRKKVFTSPVIHQSWLSTRHWAMLTAQHGSYASVCSPLTVRVSHNSDIRHEIIIMIPATVITRTMLMVLSSWLIQCESSPASCYERNIRWLFTCRQLTHYIHHHHLLLLSPKADTHFTIPRRVEGWVNLGGWPYTHLIYLSLNSHPSKL